MECCELPPHLHPSLPVTFVVYISYLTYLDLVMSGHELHEIILTLTAMSLCHFSHLALYFIEISMNWHPCHKWFMNSLLKKNLVEILFALILNVIIQTVCQYSSAIMTCAKLTWKRPDWIIIYISEQQIALQDLNHELKKHLCNGSLDGMDLQFAYSWYYLTPLLVPSDHILRFLHCN